MYRNSAIAVSLLLALLAAWGTTELYFNTRRVEHTSQLLRNYFDRTSIDDIRRLVIVEEQARQRAGLYEQLVKENFLDHGMVANRDAKGHFIDQCDSLLFSSLRFVALHKLGYAHDAAVAWEAIRASQVDGQWLRHPTCSLSTSRDMIIGVLAALTQKPAGYRDELVNLINYLNINDGFVSNGPFYVSYLSPGLAEIVRHFARLEGIRTSYLTGVVRFGFSTMELDTYMSKVGFASHLIALVSWIELELQEMEAESDMGREDIRSLSTEIGDPIRSLTGMNMSEQRLSWLTQRLVDLDAKNMFFRYLRLRTAHALTSKARLLLLDELLKMPQFPLASLPTACNRRADYLWQRSSTEYTPKDTQSCAKSYNGVDFLWMTAMLLEEGSSLEPPMVRSH